MPTIFDFLNDLEFLRGEPAAHLLLLTGTLVLALRDWRFSLFALAGQYMLAGLLFADIVDPRLAITKMLVGLFACLILYVTARQCSWGALPADVSAEEAEWLLRRHGVRLGPVLFATSLPFRLVLAALVAVAAWAAAQQPGYFLPAVPGPFNLAVYGLAGLGLAAAGISGEPLKAGMGMLTFLTGFELLYSALEPSLVVAGLLAAGTLALAVAIAYLTLIQHSVAALVPDAEVGPGEVEPLD
jgi:hypothetical protein